MPRPPRKQFAGALLHVTTRGNGRGRIFLDVATCAAKMAAIELSCRLSGLTQREIGAYYGGISSQVVSLARKRAKVMLPADTLSRVVNIIQKQSHVA